MKITTRYEAFDGVLFASESECTAYEKRLIHLRIVGLTVDQVEAALSLVDTDLANVIETLGTGIARKRRDLGNFKRHREPKPAPLALAAPHEPEMPSEQGDVSTEMEAA